MPPKGARKVAVKEVAKKIVRREVQPEPDPESSSFHSDPDEEDGANSDRQDTPPASAVRPQSSVTSVIMSSCAQPAKKKQNVAALHLSDEQHDIMAEWLKDHDYIYINGRARHKEVAHKKTLWEKAKSMGVDYQVLKTWYESIQTKIGKITDTKSGLGTKTLTDRDKDKFSFLGNHIVHQPSNVALGLKSWLEPSATSSLAPPFDQTHRLRWQHATGNSGNFTGNSAANSTTASYGASSSATDPSETETLPWTSCWCGRIADHTAESARPERPDQRENKHDAQPH